MARKLYKRKREAFPDFDTKEKGNEQSNEKKRRRMK
jgi:hypothetical protein